VFCHVFSKSWREFPFTKYDIFRQFKNHFLNRLFQKKVQTVHLGEM